MENFGTWIAGLSWRQCWTTASITWHQGWHQGGRSTDGNCQLIGSYVTSSRRRYCTLTLILRLVWLHRWRESTKLGSALHCPCVHCVLLVCPTSQPRPALRKSQAAEIMPHEVKCGSMVAGSAFGRLGRAWRAAVVIRWNMLQRPFALWSYKLGDESLHMVILSWAMRFSSEVAAGPTVA